MHMEFSPNNLKKTRNLSENPANPRLHILIPQNITSHPSVSVSQMLDINSLIEYLPCFFLADA